MGNCCQVMFGWMDPSLETPFAENEEVDESFPQNPFSSQINPSPALPRPLDVEGTPPEFISPLHLKSMLSKERIREMQNYYFDEISRHKSTLTRLVGCSRDTLLNVEYFAENQSKETGFELINVLFTTFKTNYKADFLLFACLNQAVYIYPSVSDYELVHYESYDNMIFLVERLRTERILVISSRNMLTLRVIQKIDENRFIDTCQSIEFFSLKEYPTLKQLWEEQIKNGPGHPLIAGSYFENRNGHTYSCSFSKSDMHFSIGLKFASIFLKKNFNTYLDNLIMNLKDHRDNDIWKTKEQIFWFRDQNGFNIKPEFVDDKKKATHFEEDAEFQKDFLLRKGAKDFDPIREHDKMSKDGKSKEPKIVIEAKD